MRSALEHSIRLMLLLWLALAGHAARADTAIRLFESYAGNVNFVGTQVTIRKKNDDKLCDVFGPTANRKAAIAGIPNSATIIGAHLYWAGSAYNPDYTITFEGATVAAASDRRYYSTTIGNDFNYFSGAADVTTQVKSKRNGTYTFKGLTVSNGSPYCAVEGVTGGFALLVIYSDSSQPYRVLNMYEGFQFMRYTGITLNLSNFKIPSPMGNVTGRVSHITWEGDAALQQEGENLRFNGSAMTDNSNPAGNQFNSKSNINGDNASYGIDFDAYNIASPIIQSGETTASTRYESGQDLVLLSAEIIALPNVPAADLGLSMTRVDEMITGQDVRFTLSVKNFGPSTETGPTITDTLPDGLSYVSGSGTGWSCTASGQTVTCSNARSVASGASLPDLTLTARVTGSGVLTNNATVSGKLFDHVSGNNSASATGTVAQSFVFTDKACKSGAAFGAADQPCTTAPTPVAAGEDRTIHITFMSGGVPTRLSNGSATDVALKFALSCLNPTQHAGVQAVYAGVALPLCAEGGAAPTAWSAARTLTVAKGEASVAATFNYEDVGKVQLYMQATATGNVATGVPFVVYPYEITLSESAAALIKAGENFPMTATAFAKKVGSAQKATPNFGREIEPESFAVPGVVKADSAMAAEPALAGSFDDIDAGASSGSFNWSEVGVIKATPGIKNKNNTATYLDNGMPTSFNTLQVGRFIPHHFSTAVTAPMECAPKMGCSGSVEKGAAYSEQGFGVTVTAHSASHSVTRNYAGTYARDTALTAWSAAGGTAANSGATLTAPLLKAADFAAGAATVTVSYKLQNKFVHSAPYAAPSTAASAFLRAAEGTGGDGVTSKHDPGPEEEGLRIVSGRLLVPNGHGSERLGLPLTLAAQYWSANKTWVVTGTDGKSKVDPAKAAFTNLQGQAVPNNVISLQPASERTLAAGVTGFTLRLALPVVGTYDLLLDHEKWLPSTKGRFRFGVRKSPLIYLRESY
ncbi:DUF6701 domain-containing protein [Massilia cavernae]|uniref:DUF11 domain-containing protein n=1 Tax=Massilia cavernae TaxID=2320864 RepID=A0A418Y7G2_9BURK|nr:DUF6701 domain-containing protein [Massilia cavernae]RJG25825.1 DUF11 domain-containing protein [Massilia cavernae]